MSVALQDAGKFYEPTQLQFNRARKNGNVPRSHEVSSTVVIAVGLIVLGLLGPTLLRGLREMIVKCLGGSFSGKSVSTGSMLWLACSDIILPTLGLILGLFAAAIIGGFIQVGPVFTTQTIKPNVERISPLKGLKKMFSSESFMFGFFAILKFVLIGLTVFATLRNHWGVWGGAAEHQGLGGLCNAMASSLRQVGICIGIGLGAISIADFIWQRYRWMQNLMMTRREWLDDIRQMSGQSGRKKDRKSRLWNVTKLSARRLGR